MHSFLGLMVGVSLGLLLSSTSPVLATLLFMVAGYGLFRGTV